MVFCLPWGSLKQKVFNPLAERASSARCLTELPWEIFIGKVQFQNQQQQQYRQPFYLERSLNALLLGQSVFKPDLVAVTCIYKTRLFIFRTTEEKLEKKKSKLEH